MDRYDEPLNVRVAVKEVLGWSEGTYKDVLEAMKGPCPPPTYTVPGKRRVKVKPRELAEWWTERTRL